MPSPDLYNPDNNIYDLMVVPDNRSGPASGELYFPTDDKSVPIASGGNNAYPTAEGLYRTEGTVSTNEKGMQLDKTEEQEYVDKNGKKKKRTVTKHQGWKAKLIGVTEEGEDVTTMVWDKRLKDNRQGVWDPKANAFRTAQLIHPDQIPKGTLGCAGVQTFDDAADVKSRLDSGQHLVIVKQFKTQQELDKFKEQLRETYKRRRQSGQRSGASEQSKTNQRQALLFDGANQVMAGPQKRKVAHVQTPDTGGAKVAMGSNHVYVTPQKLALARIQDPTTKGDLVANGEGSVESA